MCPAGRSSASVINGSCTIVAKRSLARVLLCLALFVQKLVLVLQKTHRYLKVELFARFQHSEGSPTIAAATKASAHRQPSSATATNPTTTTNTPSTKEPDSGDMPEMAHALSLPAPPIDLPDNKHKDDDLACMSPEYFHIEENRLRSFTSRWPVTFISPNVLARYGFYYVGTDDTVKCYFCRVEIGLWEPQDDVIQEHLRWSPYCPLLKKRPTNNKCNELKEAASASSAASTSSAMSSASSQPSTSGISSASSSIMSTSPASSSGFSSPTPMADEERTLRCSDHSSGSDEGEDDAGGDRRVPSDGKICKICFVNEYNTAFMPCGHVVACAKCASSVSKCPLCQQPFINVLRLYLS
uniref:RING-type domain-containing protein n=1 Tax=Anopheles coluzzii TaxID=1518534 RepID=A0A8W7P4R4_ANOCL